MKRVLLVDSEQTSRDSLRDRLLKDGHEVAECETAAGAIEALRSGGDALVVCRPLAGTSAVDLLREAHSISPSLPIIMVSGCSTEMLDALREGAYYVTRSALTEDEASVLVRRALSVDPQRRRSNKFSAEDDGPPSTLVGETPEFLAIREAIARLSARPSTPVLITGESGSGKDAVARVLHAQSQQGGPFVQLPTFIAGSAEESLESFALLERAQGGTLFLGELSDVPLALQSQLLRMMEERDQRNDGGRAARVVATASRKIEAAVAEGVLRPELAFRLAVVTLELPPLRHRRPDIPLLVEHFVRALASQARLQVKGVTDGVMRRLISYSWPGNVRELKNVLECAALLGDAEYLDSVQLPPSSSEPQLHYRLPSQGIDFRELEREVLSQALRLAAGNQTRAAVLLGLTRDQIRYRMAKFGMSSRDAARQDERAA